MSKIWFCRTCGYEVPSRGRCHSCKGRLERSPLPELAPADEDDEVGYRLAEWSPGARGRLIVALIEAGVEHRFDEEDLVVATDDEERTDDLVASIPARDEGGDAAAGDEAADDDEAVDEILVADVELLYTAAERLRVDPTDMHADGDVAQASATVFVADRFYGADEETWAAVGRVTRRLLAALGADEALEDEIRLQAGVLIKLLQPLVGADTGEAAPPQLGDDVADAAAEVLAEVEAEEGGPGSPAVVTSGQGGVGRDLLGDALGEWGRDTPEGEQGGTEPEGEQGSTEPEGEQGGTEPEGEQGGTEPESAEEDAGSEDAADGDDGRPGESVYELPEWLPEQRAHLGLLLDQAGIAHSWDGGDLVVPAEREDEVEALFDQIEGVQSGDDGEERYRALEELFVAANRFVNDPDSKAKAADVVRAASDAAEGPTPFGIADAQWWEIRTRARTLADAIEHDAALEVVFGEATSLRDLLRDYV